jgi:hypothetical protein
MVTEGNIEGWIEVTGRRGRRRKQLLDNLKETRSYWKQKEAAVYRTLWKSRFGRSCEPVVRETA